MSKKLCIKVYRPDNTCIETIICAHLDAVKSHTILKQSYVESHSYTKDHPGDEIYILNKIDHHNIIDGCITIYYDNDYFMEITRIHD